MNQPSPAIVPQGAVRRLPHLALWLFALAYVLPGFIGRTPWRSADITAYGYMAELAAGRTPWLAPTLGGMPPDVDGLLPYWLGAWALQLAPSWVYPGFAARLPFIALLGLALIAVWYGIYYLARSPLAQPVAFAFGGEARPKDYARAMADGGLLAFIACLGLAQLSHETTPAVAQLCFVVLSFYAFAALPYRRWTPALAAGIGLSGLTLSGGPSMALLLALGGILAHVLDRTQAQEEPRRHRRDLWRLLALTVFIALLATVLELWRWRIELPTSGSSWQSLARLLLWFTWPVWPLVLWTLWRWHRQLFDLRPSRHLSLPLWYVLITLGATLLTPAGDRALLLALPALATLAAFALPTMNRSVSAIIDWFTLLFFTGCAIVIWVVWVAMLTGTPPQPAANVAKLLPGFEPRFIILPFVFATIATLAWGWLVKWRIGRHRAALWKSMVLPAGGAALCWLLLTTLWMPALNHARSYAPLVERVVEVVEPSDCLAWFGLSRSQLAGLQVHSRLQLEPLSDSARCDWAVIDREILRQTPEIINPALWERMASLDHPRPGDEGVVLLRRLPANASRPAESVAEFRTITRHAGTVLAGQLATMAYGVTDTIVAGRYAEASLAALSVGSALYMSVYVALMGVLQALLPAWSELHGARQPERLGHAFRQSLYLWAGLVTLGMAVLLSPDPLLAWADVPEALRGEVRAYLGVLALALPAALAFRLYSTLNQSLGHPQLVTWLQLGSLALKVPLSIWFTFGGWGLPALGAPGCAWATLLVHLGMLMLALWLLRTRPLYTPYALWQWPGRPDGKVLGPLLRLGVPSGLSILVEVTSFTLMALFIARLGTTAAAAHQIAANLAAVLYMVPLAIGIASSARTSYWLGAGQPARARHAVGVGFDLVAGSAVLLALTLVLIRAPLAGVYASSAEVVAQAVPLLLWVALYHLFDGLQALGIFVLRCWRITLTPFVIYGVLLWGLGLYGGFLLAYRGIGPWPALQTPAAFWMAGSAALALAALSFWGMIWQVLKREPRP